MIKFRMSGARSAIHELVNQVRNAFPDASIASQDSSDGLSARLDVNLPSDDAMALFRGRQVIPTVGLGTIPDGQRRRTNWRSSVWPDSGHVS